MPTLFGAATLPAVPVGPAPFTRKNWDNPVRYKLNRAYGDEFDGYNSFAQLTRRWTPSGATLPVAGDFSFPGGSAIEWLPPTGTNSSAFQIAAPAGDFEALLEFSTSRGPSTASAVWMFAPGLLLIDSVGAGAGAAIYVNNDNCYSTLVTTNIISSTNNSTGSAASWDGRHMWIAMRRTGTNLQARSSMDGSTFTVLTSGVTVSATAPFLAIAKINPAASTTPGTITLHRLNVYPGPTFFPG